MKKKCPKNSRRYSSTPSSPSKSKMLATALPPFLLTVHKAAAAFKIASRSLLKPLNSWYAQFPSSTRLAATRQERCRGNMHEAKDVPFIKVFDRENGQQLGATKRTQSVFRYRATSRGPLLSELGADVMSELRNDCSSHGLRCPNFPTTTRPRDVDFVRTLATTFSGIIRGPDRCVRYATRLRPPTAQAGARIGPESGRKWPEAGPTDH